MPFIAEVIPTDNWVGIQGHFDRHILEKGTNQVYGKPRTSRLNGKVQRGNMIEEEESY